MASMTRPHTVASPASVRPPHAPAPVNAPPGTFAPGTKVQVGNHRAIIQKYLSEGGFAHVYVVQILSGKKDGIAVLKRVAVPDKDHLASMRTEVETMKKLQGHKHIVQYIDSHASQLKGGGFEVFLLMEFCAGGGLIDFMNTRLQHRLTEPEILNIFGDVAEGVATMHYLKPPLLHRDLKVENILIARLPTSSTPVLYKLCDFGSTSLPRPAAVDAADARAIEEDVQRHTTIQYRSPEMVDVWRRQPIDEKSDIWALGVLLYKLCYYTTPFEQVGQMAILTATFKYPSYPAFSTRLRTLIGLMLKEDPKQRPDIYQVVKEVSSMTGREVPIKNIYSDAGNKSQRPPAVNTKTIGISHAAPIVKQDSLPDIAPMRRGRPGQVISSKSTPNTVESTRETKIGAPRTLTTDDPFAMLDKSPSAISPVLVDAMAQKFPSIDDFTIAHDSKARSVDNTLATRPKPSKSDLFAAAHETSESRSDTRSTVDRPETASLTSSPNKTVERPIWRVPDHSRSSSQARNTPISSQSQTVNVASGTADSLAAGHPVRPHSTIREPSLDKYRVIESKQQSTMASGRRSPQLLDLASPSNDESGSLLDLTTPVDMSDEARRERERLELLAEEERVAKATADHRDQTRGKTHTGRTNMIQMRMQNLLDDSKQEPVVRRTAEGYGRYTEASTSSAKEKGQGSSEGRPAKVNALIDQNNVQSAKTAATRAVQISSVSGPQTTSRGPVKSVAVSAPAARPKPASLRTILSPQDRSPKSAVSLSRISSLRSASRETPTDSPSSRLAALLAKDQEGVAEPGAGSSSAAAAAAASGSTSDRGRSGGDSRKDHDAQILSGSPSSQMSAPDLDVNAFTNRYPSIGGLDLIDAGSPSSLQVRDV